jgi:DNA-binding transcriptional LysR family regulator
MELRQLRYFVAVADNLHFTRAAAQLHVAQPALSQQIRRLELEIGATLLERTNRRVRLTPAGEAFRTRARLALEQAAKAASDAQRMERGEAGSVSIGFVSAALAGVLPALLCSFRQDVPAAQVDLRELEPGEQLEALRNGSLDLALLHAVLDSRDLESAVVARENLVVALPLQHPAARQSRVDLRSLSTETFLAPRRHSAAGYHEIVVAACRRAGFAPARMLSTRLLVTAVCLVAGRIGVALVPESFRENLRVKGVVYRPLAGLVAQAELLAAWRRDNGSPLLARLRSAIVTIA